MPISTLGHALLALLARKPRSGYDLVQYMKQPVGYFWHARPSHIYAELLRLEREGFVTFQVIEQHDRPDKKVYTLTQEGLAAVCQWVSEPVEARPERNELALKAYSVWLAEPEQAMQLFQRQEEVHTQQLARYEDLLRRLEQQHGEPWWINEPLFGDYVTLMLGISYERMYAAWCRWMIEQLEKQPGPR